MFTVVLVPEWLGEAQALLVEACRTLLTAEQAAALGADEAPGGVDVGSGGAFLCLDRFVMFGTDDVRLGDLYRSCSNTVIPGVICCRALGAVHKLPAVLHHGVLRVVTSAGVAGVGWTVDTVVVDLGLRPDCVSGETGGVVTLTTAGH